MSSTLLIAIFFAHSASGMLPLRLRHVSLSTQASREVDGQSVSQQHLLSQPPAVISQGQAANESVAVISTEVPTVFIYKIKVR